LLIFLQRLEYNLITAKESTDMAKVGRYTVEERKDRISRYLKKRNQRNFNKTIKVIKFQLNPFHI
jgi:hypothetical protein